MKNPVKYPEWLSKQKAPKRKAVKQSLPVLLKKQVILGNCPSKSNCYRIVAFNGHASLAKTKALKEFEKSFYLQCNYYRNADINRLVEFHVNVFYPSNRSDLDNAMKVLLDCLQHVKAIPNDNKVIKIVAQKFIDKSNPRIEFVLVPVN